MMDKLIIMPEGILREDILQVGKSCNITVTEEHMKYVAENYDFEAEIDPTGIWYLWIENLLYFYEENRQ